MWPSLLKIQYTELKLSCETTLLSKIIFIATVTLTFGLMTAINRVVPLPQGYHVVKFGKDPIYRTKVIMRKDPVVKNYINSNSDLDL